MPMPTASTRTSTFNAEPTLTRPLRAALCELAEQIEEHEPPVADRG
jgi:hypothetical protein